MGDMIEAIRTDDPRFDAGTVSEPIPMRQAADVISVFSRIADKGIVMLDGNHELKLHRYGSLGQYMADSLGIQYGTYSSVVSFLHDGSLLFRGFSGGPASGSMLSRERLRAAHGKHAGGYENADEIQDGRLCRHDDGPYPQDTHC